MSYSEYVTSDDHFEDPLEKLARANRFTLADLEQNRNGKISDTQWMRLLLRPLKPVRLHRRSAAGLALVLLRCADIRSPHRVVDHGYEGRRSRFRRRSHAGLCRRVSSLGR